MFTQRDRLALVVVVVVVARMADFEHQVAAAALLFHFLAPLLSSLPSPPLSSLYVPSHLVSLFGSLRTADGASHIDGWRTLIGPLMVPLTFLVCHVIINAMCAGLHNRGKFGCGKNFSNSIDKQIILYG